MRENNPRYNEWLKRFNEKKHLRELANKRRREYLKKQGISHTDKMDNVKVTTSDDRHVSVIDATAPPNFSIARNTVKTVKFFNSIIHSIRKARHRVDVTFNLENISEMTIDSVMYLLAVLYNMKTAPNVEYHIRGNYPRNPEILRYFIESGFVKFVRTTNRIDINRDSGNLEICSGNTIDEQVAKKVCDFVIKCFNTSNKYTRFLYNIMIELMANTCQHAYDEKSPLVKHWYTFVEYVDDKIKFIFLDTGSGIPATVTKRFHENLIPAPFDSDSKYIISALNGEQRTKTKLRNRGRGLKFMRDCYEDNEIQKLTVISGKGYCNLKENPRDISEEFNGTLYYLEIDRNSMRKES